MSEKDLNALIERLEAWAPLIASGLECPAASIAMHEAAQALRDRQPVRNEEVRTCPDCSGAGDDGHGHACYTCAGSGGLVPVTYFSADIEAIRAAMRRYIKPDSGITAEEFASEVIGIVGGCFGGDAKSARAALGETK